MGGRGVEHTGCTDRQYAAAEESLQGHWTLAQP